MLREKILCIRGDSHGGNSIRKNSNHSVLLDEKNFKRNSKIRSTRYRPLLNEFLLIGNFINSIKICLTLDFRENVQNCIS